MHKENYVPGQGELVCIRVRTGKGSNLTPGRPAIVISPEPYNRKVGLAIFCPVADMERGYPFEVPIPAGMPVSGVILADQLESVARQSCALKLICRLPSETTEAVLQKAAALLEREDGS